MTKKRVLVTGAGGFIGRYLQTEGLNRGHDVYGSYRNDTEKSFLEGETNGFFLEFSEREELIQRLTEFAKETGGFEYIIHCAGVTRPNKMEEFFTGNVEFTEFFVQALIDTQPAFKKFIFISSLQAMGPGDPITMEPITEETQPNPFTPYGISKYEAEKRITAIDKLDWIIFRPTSVYGPRDTKFVHEILKIIKKGFGVRVGPKDQLVSFIHVKDLVRAIWDAVDKNVHRQVYVISDGNDYNPSLVNEYIAKHLGINIRKIKLSRNLLMGIAHVRLFLARIRRKPLHVSPFKIREITARNWRVDISKLKRDLNFEPRFNLETGLRDALLDDGFINE